MLKPHATSSASLTVLYVVGTLTSTGRRPHAAAQCLVGLREGQNVVGPPVAGVYHEAIGPS